VYDGVTCTGLHAIVTGEALASGSGFDQFDAGNIFPLLVFAPDYTDFMT
jgi:hypothetical protein